MEAGRKYTTVDEYIEEFNGATKILLEEIREIIKNAAPEAHEVISYNMPAYKLNSVLVYFAGYKGHIGFYPTPSGINKFQNEFSEYKSSKGAVQFPIDKPLPKDLIERIVKFRLNDDIELARLKKLKSSNKKS
jgi:uncharacterized protein YdhG (YjbR/CyaY superfamily)